MVATPIGNAADITLRALDILGSADFVACEDTRVTGRLLHLHGLSRPLVAYHDHNAARALPAVIERLKNGEKVALVSDAGTPLVSDPGYRLVRAAIDAGIEVAAVPGPSSVTAALSIAGLPTDRFFFQGFLPRNKGARRQTLAEIAAIQASLLFMESAKRLAATLADMAHVLGPRPAAVARELTKLHEEVRRGRLPELAAHYRDAGPPKGEVVIVIGPPDPAETPGEEAVDDLLRAALAQLSVKEAAALVAGQTGISRRPLYARALALKGQQ